MTWRIDPVKSSALVPIGVGVGALYFLSKRAGGGASTHLNGTVPPGRPFVRLVFQAESTPLSSLSNIANLAREKVASITAANGSPVFTVTSSASAATDGVGTLGYAFTTVIARVAGFEEGQSWDGVINPLTKPFGGIVKGNIALADVATVPDGSLDLSRQIELAAGAKPLFDLGDTLKGISDIAKLALGATIVVGGIILLKELGVVKRAPA